MLIRLVPLSRTRLFPSAITRHSSTSTTLVNIMEVAIVPCLQDNYAYLLIDKNLRQAAAIDPVEPTKVLHEIRQRQLQLTCILTTHHHQDHAGGNSKLLSLIPHSIPVYAGDHRVQAISHQLQDGQQIKLGDQIMITALHTPCHTSGHMSYYCTQENNNDPIVFTGDTLFLGGCGRFFEGSPDQMLTSLDKLAGLPPTTRVYCGHEYTLSNLKFSASVDSTNHALLKRLETIQPHQCTMPGTISQELLTNPFMRTRDTAIQSALNVGNNPVSVMQSLRKQKNEFQG